MRSGLMLGIVGMLVLARLTLLGASPGENRAFTAAKASFDLGMWERAEAEFADFAVKFPSSERRAEVLLRQAQARYHLTNSPGVLELLVPNLDKADILADEYQFWIAEAHFQTTNYSAAAAAYAQLAQAHTNSPRRLEAAYAEALAHARLGDWPRVVELLANPEGAFQQALRQQPAAEAAARGLLLLGEARFIQKNFQAARDVLRDAERWQSFPELNWRRHYLLGRALLAEGRPAEALEITTNLLALATALNQKIPLAESVALQASLLERLDRAADAVAVYARNLAEGTPEPLRGQALRRTIDLIVAGASGGEVIQQLEKLLAQYPQEPETDTVLLALGELYLKDQLATETTNRPTPASGLTNQLALALTRLDALVTNYPQSSLLGRAQLNRGWCLLKLGQITNALPAFASAVALLPPGEDQAVARFKLADCLYERGDFGGALTNYAALLESTPLPAAVSERLAEPALYQIVRCHLKRGDLPGATNTLATILKKYPESFLCDRSALLVGQELNRRGNPAEARSLFNQVKALAADPPLLPDLELAIARTYEQEADWEAAVLVYNAWVTNFTNHPARPRAEFHRAWASSQAGDEAGGLNLFTNFVAAFPTNDLAPLAQNWIADYFFRQGDYKSAEENYQLLFQKWPASELAFPAMMMAGRAAVARQGLADAAGYFTNLINHPQCPPNLLGQALFAYGDTLMSLPPRETNQPLANVADAVPVFRTVQELFPTNDIADLALGRLGDCYLQLGAQDSKQYDEALRAYGEVVDSPRASVAVRSQAEYGMALVREKQALLQADPERSRLLKIALNHYVNILVATNLRENENAEPAWLKRAGLAAARLAEDLHEWQQVVRICEHIQSVLPTLGPSLERRKARAEEQLRAAPP
jgi:TolA-binding protein